MTRHILNYALMATWSVVAVLIVVYFVGPPVEWLFDMATRER